MSEEDWLSGDYSRMLRCVGPVSERKHRLFNVACCRLVWHLFLREAVREAILVGEAFADGLADRDQLRAALRTIHSARAAEPTHTPQATVLHAAGFVASDIGAFGLFGPVSEIATILANKSVRVHELPAAEVTVFAALLVEFFGNPFRRVKLDPAWLSDSVTALARGIYDDHAFDAMPILADALEDARCTSGDVLAHCRSGGPHYRGCWVLDLLLGKK
jgi:hypothetical protein